MKTETKQKKEYNELIETFINELEHNIENKKILAWNLVEDKIKKFDVYVEKDYKIESILESERNNFSFKIYTKLDDENLGESSFNVNPNENIDKFKEKLNSAIKLSKSTKLKKFKFPEKNDSFVEDKNIDYSIFYNKRFIEEFNNFDLKLFYDNLLKKIKEIFNNKKFEGYEVFLNNIEFLNTIFEKELFISNGINKSRTGNSTKFLFNITIKDLKTDNEKELNFYEEIPNIYNFDFEKYFNDKINYLLDLIKSTKANSYKGAVLLNDNATVDFINPDLTLNPIIAHCSGRINFLKLSKYKLGEKILETKFDKINISSNPFVKDNSSSTPFDLDGITAKKISLIENNIFKSYFSNKQYCDYLNVKPTGPFSVIEIPSGKKEEKELRNGEYLEIISFSSFVPDSISGDFSAEIRFGYIHKNRKKIPFTGGLFSGNVFEIFKEVEFSKEIINRKGYLGPKVFKFHKGEIVGLE